MTRQVPEHAKRFLVAALIVAALAVPLSARTLTVYMIANDQGYAYLMNEVVPRFEAEHGVDVDVVRVTWGNRMDRIVTATAGGVPPDIFMSGAEDIPVLVEAGWLHPIDAYLADWPELEDFYPPALGSSTYQGKHYGLPIYTSPRPFWYRTDLFEQAGLDPAQPPATWDELIEVARRLTRTTTDGRVVQQGFDLFRMGGTGDNGNLQDFTLFLTQNGGQLFDPLTNRAAFATPVGVETLQFMKALRDAVLPRGYVLDTGGGLGNNIFRGVSAIRVDTSNIIRDFYNPDLDLSRAQYMRAMLPPPGKEERVTLVFTDWFGIHAQSSNKDLAWEFLKLFHSAEVLRDYNLAAGYQSPRRSTFMDFVEQQPMVRYVYETLQYAVPYPLFARPAAELHGNFGPLYRAFLNDAMDPQTVLSETARLWDLALGQ